jgi:hypothetical protein
MHVNNEKPHNPIATTVTGQTACTIYTPRPSASLFVVSTSVMSGRLNEQSCPLVRHDPSGVCSCRFLGRPAANNNNNNNNNNNRHASWHIVHKRLVDYSTFSKTTTSYPFAKTALPVLLLVIPNELPNGLTHMTSNVSQHAMFVTSDLQTPLHITFSYAEFYLSPYPSVRPSTMHPS